MKKKDLKKFIVLMLIFVMAAAFYGCGSQDGGTPQTVSEIVNVAVLNGPTGMGAVKLMDMTDKYEVTAYQSPTDINAKLINGEVDVAALPSNLAAVLYNKTEGGVVAVSPFAMGVLHILGNNVQIDDVAQLEGKTIVASGQGGTPEYVLQIILEKAGLTIYEDVQVQWLANHAEVNTVLQTEEGTVAMLPEPFVSVALAAGNTAVAKVFDMDQLWKEATGQQLPMGVLVATRQFAETRGADLEILLTDLAGSVAFVNEASDEAADMIVEKGFIGKAEIAKAAIPGCNIVLYAGEEGSALGAEILRTFNNYLFETAPSAIGGKLPGDDLYYGKGL